MPLNKQSVNINFVQGLNQKVDPFQLPIGNFKSLTNMVFKKVGLLLKRDGYPLLEGEQPETNYITTLNDTLVSIGETVNAYSEEFHRWTEYGDLKPCSVSTQALIRNNLTQVQVDSAVEDDLVCVVYTSQHGTSTGIVTEYFYSILNKDNGESVLPATLIPAITSGTISGSSRVFVIGNKFVLVSQVLVGGTTFLQYFTISTSQPFFITLPVKVMTDAYIPLSSNPGWDGALTTDNGQSLVFAYNTTTGTQGIHFVSLSNSQIAASATASIAFPFSGANNKAEILSLTADRSQALNQIYVSFWNPTTNNTYTGSVVLELGIFTSEFTPVVVFTDLTLTNITSIAWKESNLVLGEVDHNYTYDPTIPTHYIQARTVSSTGSLGASYVAVRSVGLASKAFQDAGNLYFLAAYQSQFQPTYFLINATKSTSVYPIVTAKLAYQNGGGYLTLGLPNISFTGEYEPNQDTIDTELRAKKTHIYSTSYLFKQNVQALNTTNTPQEIQTGGIYSQLGINLVNFDIDTEKISTQELSGVLHISGGFLGMFDGTQAVEHNFFLFPDDVQAVYAVSSSIVRTGSFSAGSTTITITTTGPIVIGMRVVDSTVPGAIDANTFVTAVNGLIITINKPTLLAGAGHSISFIGNIAAQPDEGTSNENVYFYRITYEWTDAKGNAYYSTPSIAVSVDTSGNGNSGSITLHIPTLRLTHKIDNPLKISVYRWGLGVQVYTQVTTIFNPILNDPTIDEVTFVDVFSDSQIIGNNLLYTTGGVVPDTNGPATDILTVFDTRLVLLSSENPNVIYISKSLVNGVPVEMCLQFTVYINPSLGAIESPGPVRGMESQDDKLILFKKASANYINGTGPNALGTTYAGSPLGAYSQPTFITSVVGCTNQKSIVLTPDGLMFQSDKGVWKINRSLQTSFVGNPVEDFSTFEVITANVIPDSNHVVFGLKNGPMLMYDYFVGQWGTFDNLNVVSACIYRGRHTIFDAYEKILIQTPGEFSDNSNPVLLEFTTGWINLAGLQGYERFYEFYLLASYFSPHFLDVRISYDYADSAFHQVLIKPLNFNPATPGPFGDPTPIGSSGRLEQWRIHAKQQLCESFQIQVKEVFDRSLAIESGRGFTLSGLNALVGVKKSTFPIRAKNAVG